MSVIAICEHGNDCPIAVVEVPENKTKDETFVKWFKLYSNQRNHAVKNNWSDEDILENALYIWEDLKIQKLSWE